MVVPGRRGEGQVAGSHTFSLGLCPSPFPTALPSRHVLSRHQLRVGTPGQRSSLQPRTSRGDPPPPAGGSVGWVLWVSFAPSYTLKLYASDRRTGGMEGAGKG